MSEHPLLNIFYQEPDPDRWLRYDRYPRRIIRRLVRGKSQPGGIRMIALNLMKGLDKLNIPYRFNDYRHLKTHPEEIACIIGKPQLLFERKWSNPVLFGAGVFSHPLDCPDLFDKYPVVKHCLVAGPWMQKMFEPYYGPAVTAWPTGIDTEKWQPFSGNKILDFLIYDKIRWEYGYYAENLLKPLQNLLTQKCLSYQTIRYGHYHPEELAAKLKIAKAVIFLCEHETQGLAYQQILSTGTPVLAWDRGGFWRDPVYYPHKVKFGPVSSVPYWDDRCGLKFTGIKEFKSCLEDFMERNHKQQFNPRAYILENLSLKHCARRFIEIHRCLA